MRKLALYSLFLIGIAIPLEVRGTLVTLVDNSGEQVQFEVNESDHFLDVMSSIQSHFEVASDVQGISLNNPSYNFEFSRAGVTVRSKTVVRDYSLSVTKHEKKDVAYIITTLANDSIISIGLSTSSLEKAGDRVAHLHPFRWLMTIFRDEELKAGVHAIRDRGGLTWDGFLKGTLGSLKDESAKNNLLQFTSDFAEKVKIDPALIRPALEKGKWLEFVNILIDKIPREIDPNRYDM